jgi:hypothetical protein
MRPYTRSLHPDDYGFLPHAGALRAFERELCACGVGHREWHEHRLWEYASMLQQLEELGVPKDATILDVGSGGSFFPPYLATVGGYPECVADGLHEVRRHHAGRRVAARALRDRAPAL